MPDHLIRLPPNSPRELFCNCSAGKTPQQVIAVIFISVPDERHLNAALIVKGVHVVQPLAEAAGDAAISTTKGKSRAMTLLLGLPL
jgi:hypothetical protein